jgi:oxygen-independent coproporphyrinogen-3 oxidase
LYCDFYSTVSSHNKEAWLQAAIRELEQRRDYLGGDELATIYLGGGTPSQLSASELEQVFEAIYRLFAVDRDAEITLEANPDDMTSAYIASLRSLPINRISMGIQSFSDADLRVLGRRHNSRRARQAIAECRRNGYDNISIDLIYAIPGQSLQRWEANLEEALSLRIPHISAYHLTYEDGSPLQAMLEAGQLQSASEDDSAAMFDLLLDRLSDYEHYEISNFALPGRLSRHNSSYWEEKKYLGIGPSAHSYDINTRAWNISSLSEYIAGINQGQSVLETETPHYYNEYIMTALRTSRGIEISRIAARFGEETASFILQQSAKFITAGMLETKADRLVLTRKGMFVSDAVIRAFFIEDFSTK